MGNKEFGLDRNKGFGLDRNKGFGPVGNKELDPVVSRGFGLVGNKEVDPVVSRGFGPVVSRGFGPVDNREAGPVAANRRRLKSRNGWFPLGFLFFDYNCGAISHHFGGPTHNDGGLEVYTNDCIGPQSFGFHQHPVNGLLTAFSQ